jgi:hypothetical protein
LLSSSSSSSSSGSYRVLARRPEGDLRETDYLKDLGIDGNILLKRRIGRHGLE